MAGNASDLFCFFVFILTYKKLFEKLLGQLKPRQHVNPGLPEKNWLATGLVTVTVYVSYKHTHWERWRRVRTLLTYQC